MKKILIAIITLSISSFSFAEVNIQQTSNETGQSVSGQQASVNKSKEATVKKGKKRGCCCEHKNKISL